MANVSKRMVGNSPRWDVAWVEEGGRRRKRTFIRSKDAHDFKSIVEADLRRGVWVDLDKGRAITLKQYAEKWLEAQTFEETTREATALRLKNHIYPVLGDKTLAQIKPSTVQAWLKGLTTDSGTYRRVIFGTLSTIMTAATDDELVAKNPCKAPSVRVPKIDSKKIVPWTTERVGKVYNALSDRDRYAVIVGAGLGLRQGEVFGLSPSDIDWLRGTVNVQRQVRLYAGNKQAFALPKGNKSRTVPLPAEVKAYLAAYLVQFPAKEVTLPWRTLDGDPTTVELFLTTREAKGMNRNFWNSHPWKKAIVAAGIEPGRDAGMHQLRHHWASESIEAGMSIKAVASYLGHADAAFTLKCYVHLTESSEEKARKALDGSIGSIVRGTTHQEPIAGAEES